jgi:hypothetical protein
MRVRLIHESRETAVQTQLSRRKHIAYNPYYPYLFPQEGGDKEVAA